MFVCKLMVEEVGWILKRRGVVLVFILLPLSDFISKSHG